MQKLTKSDIVIKSPGLQIREKILDKYGTLKTFADQIGLYESSIDQYLTTKNLGSSTFKIRIIQEMGTDFNSLFLSDEEQIRKMALEISDNIELYNQKKDMDVLEKIKDICIRRELIEDYAIVCRCYAHFFFNQGKTDRALAYIHLAVNYLRGRQPIDRFALFLSEMVVMEAVSASRSKLSKWISECLALSDQIKNPLNMGHILVNLGIMHKNVHEYGQARIFFFKALGIFITDPLIAYVHRHIGEIEKLEQNYDKAYEHYLIADQMLLEKDTARAFLFNEFSLYHYHRGNLQEAELFIDKIFKQLKQRLSSSDNTFLVTFTLVKSALHQDEQVLQEIKNVLEEIKLDYIYALHHIKLIEDVIEIRKQDIMFLKKINALIIKYYESHELDTDHSDAIKMVLGRLMLEFNKHNLSS